MRVCIVGGTGNISASIVRRLMELGHDVSCFNRGQSGASSADVRIIKGDRKDRASFEKAMQRERFDAAIDMICFNADDAQSSLRAFADVGHFVTCSTVATYGVDYDELPVDESHPLRPISDYGRNKAVADRLFLEAHASDGFPVTIIKPSTTYGPRTGLLRQVALELSWIDRVRKGKPVVICDRGQARHQWLHVDDAALAFAGVLGRKQCLGQIYNMTRREHGTWADYHRKAMKVLGRESQLVGVSFEDLKNAQVPNLVLCEQAFRFDTFYDSRRLFEAVPDFRPKISLEQGMRQVLEVMDREGRVPDSDALTWEDELIAEVRAAGKASEVSREPE